MAGVITGTFLVLIPIVLYFSVWRTFNLPNAPTPDKLQKAVGTYFMTAHFWGAVYVLAVGLSTTHNLLRFCPESLTFASAAFFVSLLHFFCFLYILFRATCFEAQSFKIMRYFLLFYPFVVMAYEMAFHIPGTYIIHSKVNIKIPTSDFFKCLLFFQPYFHGLILYTWLLP